VKPSAPDRRERRPLRPPLFPLECFCDADVVRCGRGAYPNDHSPAHVHVIGTTAEAVFELYCTEGPVTLRESYNFKKRELRRPMKELDLQFSMLTPSSIAEVLTSSTKWKTDPYRSSCRPSGQLNEAGVAGSSRPRDCLEQTILILIHQSTSNIVNNRLNILNIFGWPSFSGYDNHCPT
jgi:hypothetical protein